MDSAVEPGAIESLRAEVTGEVLVPGDDGYDARADIFV